MGVVIMMVMTLIVVMILSIGMMVLDLRRGVGTREMQRAQLRPFGDSQARARDQRSS